MSNSSRTYSINYVKRVDLSFFVTTCEKNGIFSATLCTIILKIRAFLWYINFRIACTELFVTDCSFRNIANFPPCMLVKMCLNGELQDECDTAGKN